MSKQRQKHQPTVAREIKYFGLEDCEKNTVSLLKEM